MPAANANWYHQDQASWRNAGGFNRTIIDDPGLATADATGKMGFGERKRCRWGSVDKLSRIFLPYRLKQPVIERRPMCAALCLVRTSEPPWTAREWELHDHFHQEAADECILRKLLEIMLKLAQGIVDHPPATQFTGRNSLEKCRD
ncbi:hypothetical protein [Pararhizobium sp. A13]|uniref:hypothetical protein n=1 Tax=Pararhizobium sp. A13 TaxID=3133975 RepID=UPI00324FA1C4